MTQPDIYQMVQSKKEEISRLAEKYGASHIRIFGSVARHEADEKSDIDFLVELEPGRTLFDLGGLAMISKNSWADRWMSVPCPC